MIRRNLILVSVFLIIAGAAFAQDNAGNAGTPNPNSGSAGSPEPALRTDEATLSSVPLGGIQRRDIGIAKTGELHFSVNASQSFETGEVAGNSGTPEYSSVSGTLGYYSKSDRNEFGLTYSGGGAWSNQDNGTNGDFQNFEVMEQWKVQKLSFMVADDISYLPQSPTVGFSGIPGMGDLSGTLGFGNLTPSIGPNQTIFSQNAQRVSNAVAGSVTYNLTGRTSVSAMGSYGILQFVDSNGYDSRQEMGGVNVSHRFSARDTVALAYNYEHFGYDDQLLAFDAHMASFSYERLWSRRLRSSIEVGPQWIVGGQLLGMPTNVIFAGNATVTYNVTNRTAADLVYTRGISGGSGVTQGARQDTVGVAATHDFGRSWAASVTGTYSRNVGISQPLLYTTKYAGAQLTRKWGRLFSSYFSYTAVQQSTPAGTFAAPVQVLQGLYHVFSFGVQFTSQPVRMRGV